MTSLRFIFRSSLVILAVLGFSRHAFLQDVESTQALVIHELKTKASSGDTDAQYELGEAFFSGKGVSQDFVESARWYERSATTGNVNAALNLGSMYANGIGVRRDFEKAYSFFRQAAKAELPEAYVNLGSLYFHGQFVKQDYQKAFDLFAKAAKQGNAHGQDKLGFMYLKGLGVPEPDVEQGVSLIKQAAHQGLANAQYNLGSLYDAGEVIEQNLQLAEEYYEKAALQNNIPAQTKLGVLYFEGKGVTKDLVIAYQWLKIAAIQGDPNAGLVCKWLDQKMKPENLAKAQLFTARFLEVIQNGLIEAQDPNSRGEPPIPIRLVPGPIRHENLTDLQISRIKILQKTFEQVDPTPLEKWLEDFKRDLRPDREIEIWEAMAQTYIEFESKPSITIPMKREAFKLLILRSGISTKETLERVQLKHLSRSQAEEILRRYPLAPRPKTYLKTPR